MLGPDTHISCATCSLKARAMGAKVATVPSARSVRRSWGRRGGRKGIVEGGGNGEDDAMARIEIVEMDGWWRRCSREKCLGVTEGI